MWTGPVSSIGYLGNPSVLTELIRIAPERSHTYVHKRMSLYRPGFRSDLISHLDINLVTIWQGSTPYNLINVYFDPVHHSAMHHLFDKHDVIPNVFLMVGDFNAPSSEFDTWLCPSMPPASCLILGFNLSFGIQYTHPFEHSYTHFPQNKRSPSILDLLFTTHPSEFYIAVGDHSKSDHAPLIFSTSMLHWAKASPKQVLPKKSDAETAFFMK